VSGSVSSYSLILGVVWPIEPVALSFTLGGTNQLLRTTLLQRDSIVL